MFPQSEPPPVLQEGPRTRRRKVAQRTWVGQDRARASLQGLHITHWVLRPILLCFLFWSFLLFRSSANNVKGLTWGDSQGLCLLVRLTSAGQLQAAHPPLKAGSESQWVLSGYLDCGWNRILASDRSKLSSISTFT